MGIKYYVLVAVIVFIIFFLIAAKIDSKRTYTNKNINSYLKTRENGEQYIYISAFSWQRNKIATIKTLFKQDELYVYNGFNYVITSCYTAQLMSIFFYEFEFGVEPISKMKYSDIKYFIYLTSNEPITINLKNTINYEEAYLQIENQIVDESDRELLLKYLKNMSENIAFDKPSANTFLELLKKYETVFSFASSIISIIASVFSLRF